MSLLTTSEYVCTILISRPGLHFICFCIIDNGLCSLCSCVFGKLAGQHQCHSALKVTSAYRLCFVIKCQLVRFFDQAIKDVFDKAVHNAHARLGDASVGMNLLQNSVDVRVVRLFTCAPAFADRGFDALAALALGLARHCVAVV